MTEARVESDNVSCRLVGEPEGKKRGNDKIHAWKRDEKLDQLAWNKSGAGTGERSRTRTVPTYKLRP